MISGKLALGGLSLEFGNSEERFKALSKEVAELTKRCDRLLGEERDIVDELARLYLPDLSPGSVSRVIEEMQEEISRVADEQDAYRRGVAERLAEAPGQISRATALLAEKEAQEQDAADALAEARDRVEAHLGADGEYVDWVAEHDAIMERRSILKTRRARLLSTANVERHRYEEHAAFRYLDERAYGEPEYRGRLLGRWLDGWLARRIGYETLRRNYRILRTGPHAIEAERRRLRTRAQELEATIDARQAEVDGRFGLTHALEGEARVQEQLMAARAAVEEATERRDALAAEARALEVHRGGPYEQALRVHQGFLERTDTTELLRLAERSPDPRDDRLTVRLGEIRDELDRVQAQLEERSATLERMSARTATLGDLARKAAARFASRRSHFSEELDIGDLVKSIIDGGGTEEQVLKAIEEAHHAEPVIKPKMRSPLDGWFAELSSQFDPELGAVTVHVEEEEPVIDVRTEVETEIIVQDEDGRVLHRRVTRLEPPRRRGEE